MTKGIYALVLEIKEEINLNIGKNKNYNFLPGYYIYIGSALGEFSNSIENRLKRHFSNDKKIFWHIDYLLASPLVKPIKAYYAETNQKKECKLAAQLSNFKKSNIFSNFGNSDCQSGCKTHLFYFNNMSNLDDIIVSAFKNIDLTSVPFIN